jgi:DNA-binding transcriptional ArsR family regulator
LRSPNKAKDIDKLFKKDRNRPWRVDEICFLIACIALLNIMEPMTVEVAEPVSRFTHGTIGASYSEPQLQEVAEMEIPLPEEPKERIDTISEVFASPKHMQIFRALTRIDSFASVADIVEKTHVSKRTVYRIIRDFRQAGILDSKTVSRRRMYKLSDDVRWIGSLIEEPEISLKLKGIPGRDRIAALVSEDDLARQILESLLQAQEGLTLRQISAETGAWAIEVKERLNLLIDEGLVIKRDLGYMLNRKVASDILQKVSQAAEAKVAD